MIRKPISPLLRLMLGIASFLVLIGGYTFVSNQAYERNPGQPTIPGWTSSAQLSSLEKKLEQTTEDSGRKRLEKQMGDVRAGKGRSILSGFRTITGEDGWLWEDAGISVKRFALGMLLGSVAAFIVGIAMGCFTPVEAFLRPSISFLASIPPTAMVAVYMMLFGLELKMFVAAIGVGIFPTLAQSIYQAVRNDVSESAIDKAYTLGASHFEVVWEVIIPQILPRILDAIRLQIGPAMIFLIAAELGLGGDGIGYRLRVAPRGNYYNVIYIYLILLGIFGMLVGGGLSWLRRWLCPWFEGSAS